jgi:hypothetical protein
LHQGVINDITFHESNWSITILEIIHIPKLLSLFRGLPVSSYHLLATVLGPSLVERPVEVHGLAPEKVLDEVGVEVPPPGVGA